MSLSLIELRLAMLPISSGSPRVATSEYLSGSVTTTADDAAEGELRADLCRTDGSCELVGDSEHFSLYSNFRQYSLYFFRSIM